MKIEEKIKEKYLYSKKENIFKKIYFFLQKINSKKYLKKSYSGSAQDLILSNYFKNQKDGFYIDIGCYHPYNGNNTKLFYDRGWSGINIDLDFHTIEFFKKIRKRDENIQVAISDSNGEKDLYFFHNRSAINSLDFKRETKAKEIKKIQTKTLESIIDKSMFKNKIIDFLSIDVEGHEYEVIKGLNLKKYKPRILLIEFLNEKEDNTNHTYQNIDTILNSKLYNYLIDHGYVFINWLNQDLVFKLKTES